MLSALREHTKTAPNRWEDLSDELDLQDQVKDLSDHKAPEGLWGKIEASLPAEEEVKPSTKSWRWLYIGILLVIIASAVYLTTSGPNDSTISYQSEVIASLDTPADVPSDQSTVDEAINYIEANGFLYEESQRDHYQDQLTELEEAAASLRQMQQQYGSDIQSTKMLAQIERDKAALIKKMITRA